MLSHIELGLLSTLDDINLSFVSDGVWTKVEIGLGRHRDQFTVILLLNNDGNPFNAGVAVDEVNFFDCAAPPAQDKCEQTQFQCEHTRGCILSSLRCDLQGSFRRHIEYKYNAVVHKYLPSNRF